MSDLGAYALTIILIGIAVAIVWRSSRRTAHAKPPQRTVEDIQHQLENENEERNQ